MNIKKNNLRIIVIDDNPAIHQDFIKILMSNKSASADDAKMQKLEEALFGDTDKETPLPEFEIDSALQGEEGIEKIEQAIKAGNPYALAFVDIRMPPGLDGIETIKRIWELDSTIQVVICSAYSDYSWEETVETLGQRDNLLILRKPFDNITIRQLACALTKKWQLVQESKSYTYMLEQRVSERTQSLEKSLSVMRATLESSADGVIIVNKENRITDYNQKFTEIWRLPKSLLESKDFTVLIEYILTNVENYDEFMGNLNKLGTSPDDTLIGKIKFKNDKIFEYHSQIYTVNDDIIGRVWSFRDITKRAFLEAELQYQATHDTLTGLPNRILLLDRIKQAMVKADRNDKHFGLIFVDLDRFKLINDSLNHEAGDEILRAVANRLQSTLRQSDTLARLGGDEFVIVVSEISDDKGLVNIARKLSSIFNDPFEIYGHELTLTTSIGLCVYPRDGRNIEVLLRNADTAMYRAKELGANQFQFYTEELNKKNMERLENEAQLRQAIARNEFFLTYQPQLDLQSGKLVSVEALIRWNHPTKGVVLPLNFIPLAEDSGLIVPIGEWVLKTACKQIKKWQDLGLPHIRVAVNVTTKQFKLYNLVQMVADTLKETGLDAEYLEIELTENVIINNADILKTIHDLKKLGVQIVLDDFGTGYSSLNYLRQIPVDRLKIDQSFVQNIDSKRGDDVIIQAIISMAKSLNLEVLAEGVENQQQLEFLKSHKCGEVQGFYFSKPMSTEDCEKLLIDSQNNVLIVPTEKAD